MNTTKLVVPMAKRYWPRPALRFDGEGPFSVAGIVHRKAHARRFAEGELRSDRKDLKYGLDAVREPNNPHDRNAVKLFGWWTGRGWFGGMKRDLAFIGYVPTHIAQAIVAAYGPDRNPDIALYSVYIGQDGFLDVKGIVIRP
jgi:hypothetical protein